MIIQILKTRASGALIVDLKRRCKVSLGSLQKRNKMYPEEEALAKVLGYYYDNVLEKSGKRLEGRRVYDLARVYMKAVGDSVTGKNKEQKEQYCCAAGSTLILNVPDD